MSKYADIEQIKEVIRTEWVKYMPMDLDMNLSFVFGKISEVPTIEVSEDCISRKDLIESFLADNECKREEAKACMCKLDLMLELIENAPSIVPTCTDSILYLESREIVNCNDCSEYDTCEFEFIKARNGYCYLGERSEE